MQKIWLFFNSNNTKYFIFLFWIVLNVRINFHWFSNWFQLELIIVIGKRVYLLIWKDLEIFNLKGSFNLSLQNRNDYIWRESTALNRSKSVLWNNIVWVHHTNWYIDVYLYWFFFFFVVVLRSFNQRLFERAGPWIECITLIASKCNKFDKWWTQNNNTKVIWFVQYIWTMQWQGGHESYFKFEKNHVCNFFGNVNKLNWST